MRCARPYPDSFANISRSGASSPKRISWINSLANLEQMRAGDESGLPVKNR
jgi:hypothetical protein